MKDITLYVTTYCSYCQAAINYVKRHGYPHKVITLDQDPGLRRKISDEQNGWPTVPMIFVGEEFIGGYSDMMALAQTSLLEQKVHADA